MSDASLITALAPLIMLLLCIYLLGIKTHQHQRHCRHPRTVLRRCHATSADAYGGCTALTLECATCGKTLAHNITP